MYQALTDIFFERLKQDEKWGGPNHDDQHTLMDWTTFLKQHSSYAEHAVITGHKTKYRKFLVEVAALAVAALEAFDRSTDNTFTNPQKMVVFRSYLMDLFQIPETPPTKKESKAKKKGFDIEAVSDGKLLEVVFHDLDGLMMDTHPLMQLEGDSSVEVDTADAADLMAAYVLDRWPDDEVINTGVIDDIGSVIISDMTEEDPNHPEYVYNRIIQVTPEDREKALDLLDKEIDEMKAEGLAEELFE